MTHEGHWGSIHNTVVVRAGVRSNRHTQWFVSTNPALHRPSRTAIANYYLCPFTCVAFGHNRKRNRSPVGSWSGMVNEAEVGPMKRTTKMVVVGIVIAVVLTFFFLAPIRDTGSHFCSPPFGSSNVCAGQPNVFESYESLGCFVGIGTSYADGQYTVGCSWPAA
jgi:hypothetical protein